MQDCPLWVAGFFHRRDAGNAEVRRENPPPFLRVSPRLCVSAVKGSRVRGLETPPTKYATFQCYPKLASGLLLPLIMNPDTVTNLGAEALRMILLLSFPMLAVGLVVGLAVSMFQAVTQLQEITLTFVPKIVAVFLTMVIAAPWLMRTMVGFTRHIIESIPSLLQ